MPDSNAEAETWSTSNGELAPVLWSESSPQAGLLAEMPHWSVVPGRLHLALAVVAPTPHGTFGPYHVLHRQLGEFAFDPLMAEACVTLAAGLHVDVRETPEGRLLSLTGRLVAAAVCLPEFHRTLSELAGAPRLVAGLTCQNEIYVAAADSDLAPAVERLVQESAHPTTELVPTVVHVSVDGVEFVSERADAQ